MHSMIPIAIQPNMRRLKHEQDHASIISRIDLAGAVLDEVEAVLGVAAHQPVDEVLHRGAALLVLGGAG